MKLGARWIVGEEGIVEDAHVVIEGDRIVEVGVGRGACDEDLGNTLLMPGLVNAHSHAFQRAIRGRTEYRDPSRPADTFWTWRDQMYTAALGMDRDAVYETSRRAFAEMALSGITTVGEFHYLHHDRSGAPYDDPNALGHLVVEAARSVGLRVALLRVAYHEAGPGRGASDRQRRFVEPSIEVYLERLDALHARWADDPFVTVGTAPHSVRAVDPEWLTACGGWAEANDAVLHIHASEQRQELEECRAAYGVTPIELIDRSGALSRRTTIVHATHATDDEIGRMADRSAVVCACPTTERNLGDGFLPARRLVEQGVGIALGSDSQANIDLWEEMRCVEYHERLREEARNVLAAAAEATTTAEVLLPMGTSAGARALGLESGTIGSGRLADLVALDLEHPTMWGADAENAVSQAIFTATPSAVSDVWVGGERVVTSGALSGDVALE